MAREWPKKSQRRAKEGPKKDQRRARGGPEKGQRSVSLPLVSLPLLSLPRFRLVPGSAPARPRLGSGSAPARFRLASGSAPARPRLASGSAPARPRFASSLFAPSIFAVKNCQRGRRIRKTHGRGAPKKEGERFRPLFFSRAPLGVSLIVANPSGLVFCLIP